LEKEECFSGEGRGGGGNHEGPGGARRTGEISQGMERGKRKERENEKGRDSRKKLKKNLKSTS